MSSEVQGRFRNARKCAAGAVAYRFDIKIDRPAPGGAVRSRASVPLLTRVLPGDTIVIKERWF